MIRGAGGTEIEIKPGVAAIVRDKNRRLLLHQRVVGEGWAPPSGAVEPGETLMAALVREIREETTLVVNVTRLVAIYSDPTYQVVQYPDGRRIHFGTCLFDCEVAQGELKGSAEGRAWKWFEPSALPEDLLPYARVWLTDASEEVQTVRVR